MKLQWSNICWHSGVFIDLALVCMLYPPEIFHDWCDYYYCSVQSMFFTYSCVCVLKSTTLKPVTGFNVVADHFTVKHSIGLQKVFGRAAWLFVEKIWYFSMSCRSLDLHSKEMLNVAFQFLIQAKLWDTPKSMFNWLCMWLSEETFLHLSDAMFACISHPENLLCLHRLNIQSFQVVVHVLVATFQAISLRAWVCLVSVLNG